MLRLLSVRHHVPHFSRDAILRIHPSSQTTFRSTTRSSRTPNCYDAKDTRPVMPASGIWMAMANLNGHRSVNSDLKTTASCSTVVTGRSSRSPTRDHVSPRETPLARLRTESMAPTQKVFQPTSSRIVRSTLFRHIMTSRFATWSAFPTRMAGSVRHDVRQAGVFRTRVVKETWQGSA